MYVVAMTTFLTLISFFVACKCDNYGNGIYFFHWDLSSGHKKLLGVMHFSISLNIIPICDGNVLGLFTISGLGKVCATNIII